MFLGRFFLNSLYRHSGFILNHFISELGSYFSKDTFTFYAFSAESATSCTDLLKTTPLDRSPVVSRVGDQDVEDVLVD